MRRFEVYWFKAVQAGNLGGKDSAEAGRTKVLEECVDLFEFLCSGGAGIKGAWLLGVGCDSDVVRAGGMRKKGEAGGGGAEEDKEEEERLEGMKRGKELTKRLLMDIGMGLDEAGIVDEDVDEDWNMVSGSGLVAFVTKLGKTKGAGSSFEPYRSDKLVPLKTKIMHAVASGMAGGMADKLLNAGVALYDAQAQR